MKSPAFQVYPADFLADKNTLVMSTTEIGAYWLLLLVCWQENGLPEAVADLADIARLPLRQFQPMWERRIEKCFLRRADKTLTHKRLEKERVKQAENREKRQKAGTKGANARWQPHGNAITGNGHGKDSVMAPDGLSDFSLQSSTSVVVDNGGIRGFPFDHFAVLEYGLVLNPEPPLSIQQAEVVAGAVDDSPLARAVWSEVLATFKGNGHRPRYAGNTVDRFKNEMAKIADGKRDAPAVLTAPVSLDDKRRRQEELARRTGHVIN